MSTASRSVDVPPLTNPPPADPVTSAPLPAELTYQALRDDTGHVTDFRLTALNEPARAAWQRPATDLVGQPLSRLFAHTADAPFLIRQFALVADCGRAVRFEMPYPQPNSDTPLIYAVLVTRQDDGVTVTYADSSVRTREETQHRFYKTVLDNALSAIAAFETVRDATGRITDFRYILANQATARIAGLTQAELMGRSLTEVFPGVRGSGQLASMIRILDSGQPEQTELHYDRDGYDYWLLTSTTPWRDGLVVSYTDITAQKQAELQAREKTALLESIQNTTQTALSAYRALRDSTGTITDFLAVFRNEASRRVISQLDDPAQPTLLTLVPMARELGTFDRYVEVVETGQMVQFEQLFSVGDVASWYDVSVQPWDDDGVLVSVLETTELRRAERTKIRQGELLTGIVENGLAGMTLLDPVRDSTGAVTDFRYVFTNAVNARNTGRSVAEMTGHTLLELLPGIAGTDWYARLLHTTTTGERDSFVFGYEAEGIRGWFNTLFVRLGEQVLFTDLNVTELKDAEVAARQTADLLDRVMNTTPTAIVVHESIRDATGAIIDFRMAELNQSAADLLGRPADQVRHRRVSQYFPGLTDTPLFGHYRAVIETGRAERVEVPWGGRWFDFSIARFGDGVVVATQEITAMHQYRHQLELTNRDLNRSNENLRSFAYVASHDLQEPLRKLTSFADILHTQYAGQLSPEVTDIVRRINTSAGRMRLLIQDLLTYSRIGTQRETFRPVDLAKTIAGLREEELWAALRQSKAELTLTDLPTLRADPTQMRQLFQNLLGNAVKFARPGVSPVITVSCRRMNPDEVPAGLLPPVKTGGSKPAGQEVCEIAVTDNGIGFETKYTDRIFQVFQRLHGRSQYGGSGIGLAICQKIVEQHGGAITAESEPGQGSTFRVYLPA